MQASRCPYFAKHPGPGGKGGDKAAARKACVWGVKEPQAEKGGCRAKCAKHQTHRGKKRHVDAGAAKALLHKGGSLLPGGVFRVEGNFQQGGLVRVLHEGQSLGVGLSNYSTSDLKKIMGLKRHEVAAILGDAHYPEVIHRDNLLLDAAV